MVRVLKSFLYISSLVVMAYIGYLRNEQNSMPINEHSINPAKHQITEDVLYSDTLYYALGEIIDESALLQNLQSGKIRAAGLDVISQEFTSDKKNHPIIRYAREHDNLIVTPHIAGSSYESEYKAAQYTFESIKGILLNN